jgi:hypothetical protein
MGNTFVLSSLLRRSALRAVERSGECDSTHRGAQPPAGREATSALAPGRRARGVLDRLAGSMSATRILCRAHSTYIARPEFSNEQTAEMDSPFFSAPFEAHWVTDECFAHESLSSLPFDFSVASDSADSPRPGILQDSLPALLCSGTIDRRRGLLPQSFVRANRVVSVDPPIRPALLRPSIARGRSSGFGLHYPMHLLVPAILLGMAWSDELHGDSQRGPPSAQARKPRRASRSERSAVVHADDPWITVPSEQPQKDAPHRLPPLIRQQPNTQQVSTVQIPHRQRIYSMPVLRSKPSFEIHRPYLVASTCHRQLSKAHLGTSARTSTDTATELHLFEPPADRARSWDALPFVFLGQASAQFPTSPAPMAPTRLPNPPQPFLVRSPRRAPGTPGPIQQPTPTFLLEAMLPFVAALATDSKQPTQPRHALLGLQSQLYELQPSRHLSKDVPCHGPQMAGK